jgi:hypothetical protein
MAVAPDSSLAKRAKSDFISKLSWFCEHQPLELLGTGADVGKLSTKPLPLR